MLLLALMSLSAVPERRLEFITLSAINCNSFGITNFVPLTAILSPLSSVKPAMSINICSKEVSLRSAAVDSKFLWFPDKEGCEEEHRAAPSPIALAPAVKALFKIAAAFICFV